MGGAGALPQTNLVICVRCFLFFNSHIVQRICTAMSLLLNSSEKQIILYMYSLQGLRLCLYLCNASSRDELGDLSSLDMKVIDLAGNRPSRFSELFRAVHYAGQRLLDENELIERDYDNGCLLRYVDEH